MAEWDYGDYEGLLATEIRAKDPNWIIWRDGCPGGESPKDIEKRIDGVIAKVYEHYVHSVQCLIWLAGQGEAQALQRRGCG